jgi:Leucine-rich repeat (LRR) protein
VQNAPLNVSRLPALTQTYIVYLRVNNGSGVLLPEVEFSNLQTLDLSGNNINMVNMTGMMFLPNLKVLRFSNNPLTMLYANENVTGYIPLKQLNMSNTALEIFDSTTCHNFANLTKLTISRSMLQSIGDGGFKSFPQLEELDIRETPLKQFQFPNDAFKGVTQLSVLYSPNYRLCCVNSFSSLVVNARCITNERTLSSCQDLLRSPAHQVALMTLTVVTVAGNALCILIRHIKYHESSESLPFSILMNSLNIANLFSGVYCGIAGSGRSPTYTGCQALPPSRASQLLGYSSG